MFDYEHTLVYPIYIPDENIKDLMDLFLIIHGKNSYYVCYQKF